MLLILIALGSKSNFSFLPSAVNQVAQVAGAGVTYAIAGIMVFKTFRFNRSRTLPFLRDSVPICRVLEAFFLLFVPILNTILQFVKLRRVT